MGTIGAVDRECPVAGAFPMLFPRFLLAAGATMVALLAPLWAVPWVALVAGAVIGLSGKGGVSSVRSAGLLGLVVILVTLGFTPVWLVFLAGVGWEHAFLVAGPLAVRLTSVLFVGLAFKQVTSPACWLVSLRGSPRLALSLMVTFRQLPELAEDARRLRRVQQARGLFVRRRWGDPSVLLVPLFSRALDRADRLSAALLLAGWGQGRAVPVRTPQARPWDLVLAAGGLLLAVAALYPYLVS